MSILINGTPTTNSGSGVTSLTCNVPTTAAGQLLMTVVSMNLAVTIVPAATGWSLVTGFTPLSNGSNSLIYPMFKFASASEPANYNFTWGGSTARLGLIMAAYSGVNQTTPFAGVNSTSGAASTTVTFASVTSTLDSAYGVLVGTTRNATAQATIGASSGYTVEAQVSNAASAFVQAFLMSSHAQYGPGFPTVAPGSATNSQSGNFSTGTILLNPANSNFLSFF